MTMSYDTDHLLRCRELIEKKLGWPPVSEWRDFEFNQLSENIFDSTGIQLSGTTLKRVLGKIKYDSLPSSATLNALAQYLGFGNWMHFKSSQTATAQNLSLPLTIKRPAGSFSKRTIITIAALLTIVVIFGFVLLSSKNPQEPAKGIVFDSRPLADGLPNSVVFNLDLKGTKTSDVVIQQSWDSTRTVRIKPDQKEATAIYYVPGYFRAKLIVDRKIIKEHDLFIRSDSWMATIDNNPDPPLYLSKDELILSKGMHVSNTALEKLKKIERPTTITYHLVRPFDDLQSENFTLKTSFQNTYSAGPAVCKTVKLFILCSNGAFIIPFTIPGCVSSINLKLADQTWEGVSNDLYAFGIDPGQKIDLTVEVKNRKVNIFCNGKLIWEGLFKTDAGKIVGLRYSFLGAGTVYDVMMKNDKGVVAYQNDFR